MRWINELKLLAVDTATEACSAALLIDDECREQYQVTVRGHGHLILSMIDTLLAEAELRPSGLDAIAFGRGPGGFTGVRIATSVVQGIAFGADLPVVPVSTLAALAQGGWRELGHDALLAAIDARMGEVYWAAYRVENGCARRSGDEIVCLPQQVPDAGDRIWFGVGSGWLSHAEPLGDRYAGRLRGYAGERYPRAQDIATLAHAAWQRGEAVVAERALPVYVRDKVVG